MQSKNNSIKIIILFILKKITLICTNQDSSCWKRQADSLKENQRNIHCLHDCFKRLRHT